MLEPKVRMEADDELRTAGGASVRKGERNLMLGCEAAVQRVVGDGEHLVRRRREESDRTIDHSSGKGAVLLLGGHQRNFTAAVLIQPRAEERLAGVAVEIMRLDELR